MSESRNVGGVENSSQPQLVRIIGDPGRVAAEAAANGGSIIFREVMCALLAHHLSELLDTSPRPCRISSGPMWMCHDQVHQPQSLGHFLMAKPQPPSLFLLDCFLALWLTYQKANIITPNASPGISRVALLVGVLAIIFDFFCDFCSRRRRPRRRRRRRTWPLYTCQWHLWPHSRASVYPTVGRLVVSPVVAVPDVACCSVAVAVAVAADVAAAIAVFVWLNRYYGLPTTLVNMPPEHRPYDGLWMGELGTHTWPFICVYIILRCNKFLPPDSSGGVATKARMRKVKRQRQNSCFHSRCWRSLETKIQG
ncbi:GD17810 [Drosophila simulans]|uniref:GD17810 n=1 Tax=Drosophila simulans TaxID=7240 RepID=B4Q6E5_DROSI|nr:GD17810 [Drosophila simulans]